jgi:hypothetical protein
MRRPNALGLLVVLAVALADCGTLGRGQVATAPAATVPALATAPAEPSSKFGVLASGVAAQPEVAGVLVDLGAAWVRVNAQLGGRDQDLSPLLDAGLNLVITFSHRDPTNVDTTFGTPAEWPNAGFPFRSKEAYQQRVREALAQWLPRRAGGRQIWVQAENEIGDAALNPRARYWRGTTDQYLAQLQAFYEAVKSTDAAIPVVLTSFASESLEAAVDRGAAHHDYAAAHLTRLLAQGHYDAVDLHFYGCVEEIPAKVQWVREHLPAGKRWISTENGGPDPRCRTTPAAWEADPARFEQLQAEQVPARLAACADAGGSICLWFSLFDLRRESDVFAHLGLLDGSVLPPRHKPAYDAFRVFVSGRR